MLARGSRNSRHLDYRARLGSRTVNTEPLPDSLVTVTSPPIIRASLREMARPSPVPPYRRAVNGRASRSLGQRKREVNIGEGALGASCLPEMVIQSHLDATGGLAMPTTILAYVIAIVGLVLIVAGARDIYLLHNEETFEVTTQIGG